uniref:T9SS type A sorting domain-containing protein n=1 Tax=Gelidibacter sp. TaxID=2018083 RepID=UPI00404A51B6
MTGQDKRDSTVKVFPNPVTDWLTISTLQPIKNIQVYNLNGQRFKLPQQDQTVDMNSLASGVY